MTSRSAYSLAFAFFVVSLLGLLGLTSLFKDGDDRRVAGDSPLYVDPAGKGGTASTNGEATDPGRDTSKSNSAGRSPLETLAQLRESAPVGRPEEYPLTHYIAGRKRNAPWKTEVLVDLCEIDLFPEPPYGARWVFGESDRAWLERLHRAYKRTVAQLLREEAGGQYPTDLMRAQVEARVRPPYRELIWSVAQGRLKAAPELAARFDDPRSLKELGERLPPGMRDPQYRLLVQLVDNLMPSQLFEVGLNSSEDRRHLAATDLPELVQLRLDVAEAHEQRGDSSITKQQSVELHRPFAERLQAIINAKK